MSGSNSRDIDKAKTASGATKERFQDVWRSIRASADEHWSLVDGI